MFFFSYIYIFCWLKFINLLIDFFELPSSLKLFIIGRGDSISISGKEKFRF